MPFQGIWHLLSLPKLNRVKKALMNLKLFMANVATTFIAMQQEKKLLLKHNPVRRDVFTVCGHVLRRTKET